MRLILAACALPLILTSVCVSQDARRPDRSEYPPDMPGARVELYKTVGDAKLKLYVYEPAALKPGDSRPAIVFFFGGGWRSGTPRQFIRHCRYFAARGMVAVTADYRVASRHRVKAVDCVRDAKSAIRWIRTHADSLHIDPNRIAAAGGSAGGHLAAASGTIQEFDEPNEDASVSSRPNALLLFNPALVLAPVEGLPIEEGRLADLNDRLGVEPRRLSPYHHITAGVPPTIIFHGTADRTVPHATALAFEHAMGEAGNQCTLHSYADEGHGFFNFERGDGVMFAKTLSQADQFLGELGYLQGAPAVDKFLRANSAD